MKRNRKFYVPVLVAASLLLSTASLPTNANAATAPAELTDAEKEEFLRTAKVVKRRKVPVGVTHPERATLSDGRLTHDAHIQTVDIFKAQYQTTSGFEMNFRDSYKYNIAAYKLDRLLGLNMVPVSVERKVAGDLAARHLVVRRHHDDGKKALHQEDSSAGGKKGFVERPNVSGEDLQRTDLQHGPQPWQRADHPRLEHPHRRFLPWPFGSRKDLRSPANLVRCDRRIYDALRELDGETLKRELGPYLRKNEIAGLLARRDKIVKSLQPEDRREGRGGRDL